MKTLLVSSVFAALVCAAAPAFASVSDNLVSNGTFEQISGAAVSDFRTVYGGSNDIVGWTVGGSVDIVNGGFGAVTGNSIDMLGAYGPSSLSQTLATSVGMASGRSIGCGVSASSSAAGRLVAWADTRLLISGAGSADSALTTTGSGTLTGVGGATIIAAVSSWPALSIRAMRWRMSSSELSPLVVDSGSSTAVTG